MSLTARDMVHILGVPTLNAQEALNDSDVSITIPEDEQWYVFSIWVELISTATVGNRQMEVQIQDGDTDVIASVRAGALQAASLTRNYLFGVGLADQLSFRDSTHLTTPLPAGLILPTGYIIRVFDNAAIDAVADDMVVQTLYGRRQHVIF